MLEESSIIAADGVTLRAFAAGRPSAPVALLINAFGVTVELIAPLITALAGRYRVLTWNSRVLPGTDADADAICDCTTHIADAFAVLQAAKVESTAVAVGWCTGARVLLHAAACWHGRLHSVVLANGAYHLPGVAQSLFHQRLVPVLQSVLNNPKLAPITAQSLQLITRSPDNTASFVEGADERLRDLTSLPYRGGAEFLRYARLCLALDEHDEPRLANALELPTLVVTNDEDRIAAPEASRAIALAIPRAQLSLIGRTHYVPFLHAEELAGQVHALVTSPRSA